MMIILDIKNLMIKAKPLTKEELKTRKISRYKEAQENPENMSYWFPKLKETNDSVLKLPKTEIVQLDFETWDWLNSDSYTEDKIQGFNQFLLKEIEETLTEKKTLFMKTGIFSNKFNFAMTVIGNKETIGRQLLGIYYESMMLGADNTAEVVFREMIPDKEGRKKIYNGMPLHTEFRVFYDFDEKKIVGVANYWHPDVMIKSLRGDDLQAYESEMGKIKNDYEINKSRITNEVKKFMSACEGLSGKWSIDIMKNGNDLWLIDMARMEKSALANQIERVD